MGDSEAAEVADVLTEGQLTVDGVLRRFWRDECPVLFNQVLGAGFEGVAVVFGPPVGEGSVAVEAGALVVKAVPDFVADHRADRTEVGCVIAVEVEERWPQDRCRERDFVEQRVVVGVDGLRVHEPQFTVHAVLDFLQFSLERGLGDRGDVARQVFRVDLEGAVVDPFARVADLGAEFLELDECSLLGVFTHPVQPGDRGAVCLNQTVDKMVHPFFRCRREVFGHEDLADVLAHAGFDERNAAFPAFALFGGPAEGVGVEGPVFGHDVFIEVRGACAHHVEREQILPCLKGLFGELFVEPFEETWLPHVYNGPVFF